MLLVDMKNGLFFVYRYSKMLLVIVQLKLPLRPQGAPTFAFHFPSSVDARDLADAHVKVLTNPKAANRRLLIDCRPMTNTMLARELAKMPEMAGRKLPEASGEDAKVVFGDFEAAEDNKIIGIQFRSLEETVADTARGILALERKEEGK